MLVTNFPNEQRQNVFKILHHLERPVHLLFLIIAGAVWSVSDWRGWVLVPLFVAGRVLGKWTGVITAKTAVGTFLPPNFADQRNWVTPLSGLSIALVISVESLYQDAGLPWIVTAVIGGSILTEFLVTRTAGPNTSGGWRPITNPALPTINPEELDNPAHLEDLDDLDRERDAPDAPIHRDEPVAGDKSKPPHGGGH